MKNVSTVLFYKRTQAHAQCVPRYNVHTTAWNMQERTYTHAPRRKHTVLQTRMRIHLCLAVFV